MNFKARESKEKLRGGYYTPQVIADALTRWALSNGARRILEPSCGNGVFLEAIEHFFDTGSKAPSVTLNAVEIIPEEADKAREVAKKLLARGIDVSVESDDFLAWIERQSRDIKWDAIVGNPPYIRYQYFEKTQCQVASRIFADAGVPFSERTNAWVPFVIAGVMHLTPGGRLAMVLPAELLHIMHADGLRRLLEQEMESLEITDVRELIFGDVLQGVVLLRAIKRQSRGFRPLAPFRQPMALPLMVEDTNKEPVALKIHSLRSLEELTHMGGSNGHSRFTDVRLEGKWTRALLERDEFRLLHEIEQQSWATSFSKLADVDIGIVTGANKFFVVDEATASRYDLWSITHPMLARSEFMKGIAYTHDDQEQNRSGGKAVLFLEFPNLPRKSLPQKMAQYIMLGERDSLHKRFKCRIREPWYVVPYVWVAKLSLLKRCHDFPRLVLNEAGAYSTDTAYRIRMKRGYEGLEKDLVFSFLNSLTFLCAELGGRHYGGGVLELVPSEVEQLLVPLFTPTDQQFSFADSLIRRGATVDELLEFTDPLILGEGTAAKLSPDQLQTLRRARQRLRDRRLRT